MDIFSNKKFSGSVLIRYNFKGQWKKSGFSGDSGFDKAINHVRNQDRNDNYYTHLKQSSDCKCVEKQWDNC